MIHRYIEYKKLEREFERRLRKVLRKYDYSTKRGDIGGRSSNTCFKYP
jgi:hypothetical protein